MLYDKITTYWILFVVLALAICLHFIERGYIVEYQYVIRCKRRNLIIKITR